MHVPLYEYFVDLPMKILFFWQFSPVFDRISWDIIDRCTDQPPVFVIQVQI